MKNFIYLFICILIVFSGKKGIAVPEYELDARNFVINQYGNEVEWDVYIHQTNPPEAFEFAFGQYFFNFDINAAQGGTLTYELVGSEFPEIFRPQNPSIGVHSGTTVLRLAANIPQGAGNGLSLSNVSFPGVKIFRVRLKNTVAFRDDFLRGYGIQWRNAVNPYTRISAYVGGVTQEITSASDHYIEPNLGFHPQYGLFLYTPAFGVKNIFGSAEFAWSTYASNIFKFEVATDAQMNNLFYSDSGITDTYRTVSGLKALTKYYWRVSYLSGSVYLPKAHSEFTTSAGIGIFAKIIPEGLYDISQDKLNRKDLMTVNLRSTISPYAVVDVSDALVDSVSMTGLFRYSYAPSGTYYLVVNYLNGIETWSKSGGEAMNVNTYYAYDFTTANTQAFGNNLKQAGSRFCIFSGDVDQDGVIDATDIALIDNDASNFVTGLNLPTDLTGNNAVDGSDLLIGDNNVANFVSVIRP